MIGMIYTGTNPEDRILYSEETRKKLLKQNYGICACCGKKLTIKTMEIEHIIPLSRGGKNEDENKTILCHECNQMKANRFYLPIGYYHAISKTSRFLQMQQYVVNWYQSLPDEDRLNLKRFPLITPRIATYLSPVPRVRLTSRKIKGVCRQRILEWNLVGNQNRQEVEAVTGMHIREVRSKTEHNPNWLETESGVYVLKSKSTDRLLCLAGIAFMPEKHSFRIYIAWSTLSNHMLPQLVRSLASIAIITLKEIAQQEIHSYEVQSPLPHALDAFIERDGRPEIMGRRRYRITYQSEFSDPCIEVEYFGVRDIFMEEREHHNSRPSV